MTISVPHELDTLDPHARDLVGQAAIGAHFYEPLVSKDAFLAIRPRLALRWINPDAHTWVFYLRPGVRFHDGRAFSSADVVFSIERLQAHPELQMGAYVRDVVSVRAQGPLGVEIRTRSPASVLLNKLSSVLVVPASASPEELAVRPRGTGPYRFVGAIEGERIELARNPDYWGPQPLLAAVTFRLGRSALQALADIRSGTSQIAQCALRAAPRVVAGEPEIRSFRQRGIFLDYLGFDVARSVTPFVPGIANPFRDRRVRQAIDLAIDRPALVEQLPGFAAPANQLVPPLIFGFDPGLPERATDLVRARALLAEAGLPDGFAVTLHARALVGQGAPALARMLAAIGIRVAVEHVSEPEFFRAVAAGPSFFLSRYGCDNGDASDVFDAGLHSVDPARHLGTANAGRFGDRELDRQIEASASVTDHDQRRGQLQQIMARAMQELPWIPLYYEEDAYLARRPLLLQPRADSYLLAAEVTLDPPR